MQVTKEIKYSRTAKQSAAPLVVRRQRKHSDGHRLFTFNHGHHCRSGADYVARFQHKKEIVVI